MKTLSCVLFAGLLAIPVFADDAKTNTVADAKSSSTNVAPMILTFPVSAATITGPLILTNGSISQVLQQDLKDSGKAVFSFTITNAGNYVMKGIVNAPEEGANSFYLNVDAQPEDPMMIWDMSVTGGFEERTVSWRGNGDQDSDEFSPKVFTLKEGAHTLIVVAREPGTELKSISIVSKP